jgi:hypothetical protein
VKEEGTVSFFLQEPAEVNISLYAPDGSLAAIIFSGLTGEGKNIIPCYPSQAVAPGVYTLRLGIRNEGETLWHYFSRQWVILK